MIVTLVARPGWEDEVDRWYDEDHIPEKMAIDGFVAAHRYRSRTRPREFLTIYEMSDVRAADVRVEPTEWTTRVKAGWESVSRSVWLLREEGHDG
ncbi:MAG: hypothetical protein AB7L17_13405 [Ilumatobacteraceae bacterium]